MMNLTYERALELREHLVALGQTFVLLNDPPPFEIFTTIRSGSVHRMGIPVTVVFSGEKDGLKFEWTLDLESRDAQGHSVYVFDRERIRDVALKLTPELRKDFARYLDLKVLSEVAEQSEKIRKLLNENMDSEDCLRGIIAFANKDA